MPRAKKVKAAVLERSRRSTAGKRMASLVGQAQDDDDTFWSHSIWSEKGGGFADKKSRKRRREEGETSSSESGSEDGGSGDEGSVSDGEGSFRMSDEDSAAAVDQFDSDFDESESGEDEGDDEGEEERDLIAEERREAASKRKKNQRLGMPLKSKSSAGRELMRGKAGKMTKRGPLGEGMNHGLVLNWPPPPIGSASIVAKPGAAPIHHTQSVASKSSAVPDRAPSSSILSVSQIRPQHAPSMPTTIAGQPPFSPPKPNLRAGTFSATAPPTKPSAARFKQPRPKPTKKTPKEKFTQEEMILESIKFTETENGKWISGRKRSKEDAVQLEKAAAAKKSSANQNPISRFHSRRGGHNTLTFMDMDHLPEIFTRRHAPSSSSSRRTSPRKRPRSDSTTSQTSESTPAAEKNQAKCVITGKVARYRDPNTMLGYHDIEAYKELKRRLETGELKIKQPARNNNKRKRSSGSNNKGVNGLRGGGLNNATKLNHFPFDADQPTMVAQFLSARPDVKVIVTQDGFPVSPPPGVKLPLHLPPVKEQQGKVSNVGKKEPPPSAAISDQKINGKPAVDNMGSQVGQKEPLLLSVLPAQIISGKLPLQLPRNEGQGKVSNVGKKKPPPLAPISDQKVNGKPAVNNIGSQVGQKEPLPLSVLPAQNISGKLPLQLPGKERQGKASNVRKKESLPSAPMSDQKVNGKPAVDMGSQVGQKEPLLLSVLPAQNINGKSTVDNSLPANDIPQMAALMPVPVPSLSSRAELQTSYFTHPTKLEAIEPLQQSAASANGVAGIDNRNINNGVQPEVTVSSNATAALAMKLEINEKVETANNSGENSSNDDGKAPPETGKSKSTGNGAKSHRKAETANDNGGAASNNDGGKAPPPARGTSKITGNGIPTAKEKRVSPRKVAIKALFLK